MISVVVTFCLSVLSLCVLIRLAPVLGLIDNPGGRKQHRQPTPVVGGLAISFSAIVLLGVPAFVASPYVWMLPAILMLVCLGFWDDRNEIPYRIRFIAHLLAGVIMAVLGNNVLYHLGDLVGTGTIMVGMLAIPLTAFAVASAVNALNLIDGVDGLASGLALIPLVIMAVLSANAGLTVQAVVAGVFSAAVVGFMLFNYPFPWLQKATCFLGDVGSSVLGFVIVWLMIDLSQRGVVTPITALYLLGIPLLDTAAVIIRRRRLGLPPMTPGRDHLHHILVDAGFSTRATVMIIHGAALLFAMAGVLMAVNVVPEWVAFSVYLVVMAGYLALTRSNTEVSQHLATFLQRPQQPALAVPRRFEVIQGGRGEEPAYGDALDVAYAAVEWSTVVSSAKSDAGQADTRQSPASAQRPLAAVSKGGSSGA